MSADQWLQNVRHGPASDALVRAMPMISHESAKKGRWDYVVQSYKGGKFMIETVHRGLRSLTDELYAIHKCGRQDVTWRVTDRGFERLL